MYKAKVSCTLCGHYYNMEHAELWHIINAINGLEKEVHSKPLHCDRCQEMGPLQVLVTRMNDSAAIFEKIIYNDKFLNPTTNTKDSSCQKLGKPCFPCCATGKFEVQYKAHKKENTFKGVLTEPCPVCGGKGYMKI